MSRFSVADTSAASGLAAELFAGIKKAVGRIPNTYAMLGSHSPAALRVLLQADEALHAGKLSRAEIEAIKLTVSEISACEYCIAAHTVIGKMAGLSAAVSKQIRAGIDTGDARRDALVRFARHMVQTRGTVDIEVLNAVRAAGYSEQQVVEALLAISAITFTNLVNRLNDTDLDFPAVD